MEKAHTKYKFARQSKGIKQSELAEEAGVASCLLSMIECGHHVTKQATTKKIIKALGVSESLLEEHGKGYYYINNRFYNQYALKTGNIVLANSIYNLHHSNETGLDSVNIYRCVDVLSAHINKFRNKEIKEINFGSVALEITEKFNEKDLFLLAEKLGIKLSGLKYKSSNHHAFVNYREEDDSFVIIYSELQSLENKRYFIAKSIGILLVSILIDKKFGFPLKNLKLSNFNFNSFAICLLTADAKFYKNYYLIPKSLKIAAEKFGLPIIYLLKYLFDLGEIDKSNKYNMLISLRNL